MTDVRAHWPAEDEHAAHVIGRLNAEPLGRAVGILTNLPLEFVVEMLDCPKFHRAGELLLSLAPGLIGEIVAGMSSSELGRKTS